MAQPAPDPAQPPDAFITGPLSTCLDLVRFLAALVVMVCHAPQAGLWSGWFPAVPMAQHYAVVVFFVLSGLVITASVQRRQAGLAGFAISRAARILPVSIVALAFSSASFAIVAALAGSPARTDAFGELSWRGLVLPLLFLSEGPWGTRPVWNPPYWSLCYEVWYYALFGAAVYLRGGRRIAALLCCSVLAGPRILLMLPVWLVGAGLAQSRAARRIGPASGAALLCAGLAAAALHTQAVLPGLHLLRRLAGPLHAQLSFSRFALSDFLLAVAVAAILAGLRPLAGRWHAPWTALARPARILASFSFTLYLFHWPLLLLARSAGLAAGTNLPLFLLDLLGLLFACFLISLVTERQSGRLRAWLERHPTPSSHERSTVLGPAPG